MHSLYAANDKSVYFHEATVKNKFIRIKSNGEVLYSIRFYKFNPKYLYSS